MKRCGLFGILIMGFSLSAGANHITGGEIFYTLIRQSGNSFTYSVTLKLYRDSLSTGALLDGSASIGIFERATGSMILARDVPLAFVEIEHLWSPDPCINNPPTVIYQVGHYDFTITLAGTPNGYIISYQRCCRIAGINNILGSTSLGATYTAEIPGTSQLASAPANNSAHFIGPDTVIVCQHNSFTYSFNAYDDDGDSLAYSFCDAYNGGSTSNPMPVPPANPPYQTVPYSPPFTTSQPMGNGIKINPTTGLVTGLAPDAGIYIMTVCAYEYRNKVLIATQRKDLQVKVGDCSVASVTLPPQYVTCDGYSWTFSNQGDQTLIKTYLWNFGDPASGNQDSSMLSSPTHVFTDTGAYRVKLVTNKGQSCSDTGSTIMKVYPGFFPGFSFNGVCFNKPTQFLDNTATQYGVVDSWNWDFGIDAITNDTSHVKNPSYIFSTAGTYKVQLIVTNTKGCVDTASVDVTIIDKPPINLGFRDTLICRGDNLQLRASGTGIFSWTPGINITNPDSATPVVDPSTSGYYFVKLDDNGCVNNDSVRVRVVDFVTLHAFGDTTICEGDAINLHAKGDALHFLWTPSADMNDPTLANPLVITDVTTIYRVTASIGHCSATQDITVKTIPYPVANAGPDTTICYNSVAQLHASLIASAFSWSPASSLSDPLVLNPSATPQQTTAYILKVTDVRGCPKAVADTVVVTVLPRVTAFAGHDTSVVVGEPLHFHASGGINYLWSPPAGLDHSTIADPVAVYDGTVDSIHYNVIVGDEKNCFDSASINVRIFKTTPEVFVPTAFTPNGDGMNDLIRPIGVGIKSIEFFSIYNRWGQLVFTTTINGDGWDGTIGGKAQASNTYVWVVKGVDYGNKPFLKRGTVTLIR